MDYDIDLMDYLDASDLRIEQMNEEEIEEYRYKTESQMSLCGLSWSDFL